MSAETSAQRRASRRKLPERADGDHRRTRARRRRRRRPRGAFRDVARAVPRPATRSPTRRRRPEPGWHAIDVRVNGRRGATRARASRLPALTSGHGVAGQEGVATSRPCAQACPPTLFSADARHPGDRGRPGGTAVGRGALAVPRRGAPLRPRDGAGGDRRAAGAAPARRRPGLRGARRQDLRRRRRTRLSPAAAGQREPESQQRSRPRGGGSTPGPWRSTSRRWRRAIPPRTSPPCGCT